MLENARSKLGGPVSTPTLPLEVLRGHSIPMILSTVCRSLSFCVVSVDIKLRITVNAIKAVHPFVPAHDVIRALVDDKIPEEQRKFAVLLPRFLLRIHC